jgi:hypothetical protein
MAANATLANRIDSAAKMVFLLRNSNDTFTSDWIGVVSSEVKNDIEKQKSTQKGVFDELDNLRRSQRLDVRSTALNSPAGVYEALNRISEQASTLPESIRPEIKIPAVTSAQVFRKSSPTKQEGHIILTVHRPVFMATGTGKLVPEMASPPRVFAKLITHPPEGSLILYAHCGAGTNFDFNVHIKSKTYGVQIKPGEYKLQYTAEILPDEVDPEFVETDHIPPGDGNVTPLPEKKPNETPKTPTPTQQK